ncbi:MAG: SDR family oxidoreductase, partial [Deltaproteobacteria bacterium]
SGIGRETAVVLGQLGARLVLSGRNEERLSATMAQLPAGEHRIEPFDLDKVGNIPDWLLQVSAKAGKLHGLVHCAGVSSRMPVRFMSCDQADAMMRTNWTSAWALAKGFRQKKVCAEAGGRIVLVSSVSAVTGQAGATVYASTKGAIVALTRSLAMEFAAERIHVNAVLPGLVQTEMADGMGRELTPVQFQGIVAKHPLGLGQPRDVAYAIAYLLAETSRWITGSILTVDGGYTAQ